MRNNNNKSSDVFYLTNCIYEQHHVPHLATSNNEKRADRYRRLNCDSNGSIVIEEPILQSGDLRSHMKNNSDFLYNDLANRRVNNSNKYNHVYVNGSLIDTKILKPSMSNVYDMKIKRKAAQYFIGNVNENRNDNSKGKLSIQPTNVSYFYGLETEDVYDWLRQFKNYQVLYEGLNEYNIHLYASSYLKGDAGKFYDAVEVEPVDFTSFRKLMIDRYGKYKLDRPTMLSNFLNCKHGAKQSLKEYGRK